MQNYTQTRCVYCYGQ